MVLLKTPVNRVNDRKVTPKCRAKNEIYALDLYSQNNSND